MKRVLVTAGGTRECIDGVRYLSNFSTGRTGLLIAEQLYEAGFDVVLLRAKTAPTSPYGFRQEEFEDYASLAKFFTGEFLKNFDCLIQAAAVADFVIERILQGNREIEPSSKLSSDTKLSIELRPTPKLIQQVKKLHPQIYLIGFKLTNTEDLQAQRQAVHKLFTDSKADLVVFNDLRDKGNGQHLYQILRSDHFVLKTGTTSTELAADLCQHLKEFKHVSLS